MKKCYNPNIRKNCSNERSFNGTRIKKSRRGGGNSEKLSVARVLKVLDFELFRKFRSFFVDGHSAKASTQRGEFTPSLIREGRDGFQPLREKPEELAPTSILPHKGGCRTQVEQTLTVTSCPPLAGGGFAYGRSKTSPDSEQIEYTVARQHVRNSESVEQIQDRPKSLISRRGKKVAFTLAEVLITLGIIGVVAAITMPVLLSNVQDRVKQKRVENIKQKLSKVTDKMAVQSGLTGYGDTMAFVQEMSKHMKLAKICDNDHISDCWPTQEVTISKSGKIWEISKTTDAKSLLIRPKERSSWSNTVGIVTADGTPMILSYKKDCDFDVDKSGLIYSNGSATSNSLNCLSGVFDWNGGKNPNKLGDDVITFGKARGLGKDCTIEIGGKCFSAPFTPDPLTRAECEEQKNTLGIYGCDYEKDYWAGAVTECGHRSKMPTMSQLGELATELYGTTVGASQDIWSGLTLDTSKASSLGFGSSFSVWSNIEVNSSRAGSRRFGSSSTYWNDGYGTTRDRSYFQAMCLGD